VEKKRYRGGRREYRAIVAKTIEPKELGLAGALQIARVDRRIGARGELHSTWLAASRDCRQLDEAEWLRLEQQRWGVENRTHHTLDVTYREDQSRVRHPNATVVLGILRRLSNAFKHVWAIGRPRREATSADWIERNASNRRLAIDLITRPVTL
jgi:predicted transposase YbfD/YdcC